MDDEESPIYGTKGFQAPEIADTGPTPPSDHPRRSACA